jgi:hypothetical protein
MWRKNLLTEHLGAHEYGVLVRLAQFVAYRGVNGRYSEASRNPRLPLDQKVLATIARCHRRGEFQRAWRTVGEFFERRDDGYYLKDADDVIRILKRQRRREPLADIAKNVARGRSSDRCAYCGDAEGPFHHDHLYPVSRGGSDEPHNIVLACISCNLSKGSKTLEEWVCGRIVTVEGKNKNEPRSRQDQKLALALAEVSRKLASNDRAKLQYCYFHTCPHGNSIGCYPIAMGYMMADLFWGEEQIAETIDHLVDVDLIDWNADEQIVRIVGFVGHDQPTNFKHATFMVKEALAIADCAQKLRVIKDLLLQHAVREMETKNKDGWDRLSASSG